MFSTDETHPLGELGILIACIMLLGSGTTYLFPLYGQLLRDQLHFTQTETAILGGIQRLGIGLSFITGYVIDGYGSKAVSLLAIICSGGSYFMLYCIGYNIISYNFVFVAFLFYCEGVGGACLYHAAFSFIYYYKEDKRGIRIGIIAGSLGLAAAIWSQIYAQFYEPNILSFLGFMSIATSFLGILGILTTKKPQIISISPSEIPKAEQYTTLQVIFQKKFFLLSSIVFFINGSSATIYMNLTPLLLSSGGRFLFGYLSDYYSKYLTKAHFLGIVAFILALSQIPFLLSHSRLFWLGCILDGLGNAGIYSLYPNIVMTLFGKLNFGKNMAVFGAATGGSTLFIASILAGELYDMNIDDKGYCLGFSCFGYILIFNIITCCIAIILSYILSKHL